MVEQSKKMYVSSLVLIKGGDGPEHGREVPGGGVHHAAVRPPAHHQAHRNMQLLPHLDRHGARQTRRTKVNIFNLNFLRMIKACQLMNIFF